jgi:tetratricopeptide (TPR) repeat protein
MFSARIHPLPAVLLTLALLAGGSAVAYARWARPLVEADEALAAGETRTAIEHYAVAERRFSRFAVLRSLFPGEYATAVYNQLALLYREGEYDAVLEKASTAPPGASPHLWTGLVLLTRALADKNPESRLLGLSRAEDELKQALQAAPDDWDARFNYEIAARLAAHLRQPPRKGDDSLQLLRPQPRTPQPARKVG